MFGLEDGSVTATFEVCSQKSKHCSYQSACYFSYFYLYNFIVVFAICHFKHKSDNIHDRMEPRCITAESMQARNSTSIHERYRPIAFIHCLLCLFLLVPLQRNQILSLCCISNSSLIYFLNFIYNLLLKYSPERQNKSLNKIWASDVVLVLSSTNVHVYSSSCPLKPQ